MKSIINRKFSRRATNVFLATFMAIWQLAVPLLITRPAAAFGNGYNPVTICHATGSSSNPYIEETVDDDAVDGNGNNSSDHNRDGHQNGEDIIPPTSVDPDSPDADGRNWTTTNQKIWNNDCETTRVEVKKVVAPSNDPGLFNLRVENVTYAANVGDGGSTGEVYIDQRHDITISETAGTNTLLNGYSTAIVCKNQKNEIVKSSTNTSTEIDSSDIKKGDDIVCTITNTRKMGNVKIVKDVVNDNGGTKTYADFTFKTSDGDTPRTFEATTSPDGEKVVSLPAGASFTVSEVEANTAGYATTYTGTCTGTIVENQTQVCTITNDDIAPKLTVTKIVNNNNGGTKKVSDFPLFVNGNQVLSGAQNTFNVGQVTVTETNQPGYTGVFSGDCDLNGLLTMAIGGVYTCTITNSDQPGKLIVKKVIKQNNGGTETYEDFSFSINGDSSVGFEADGENEYSVPAGTYTVVEDAYDGYATTYDNCTDVVVANGETATCTITNKDVSPKVVIKKHAYGDSQKEFGFQVYNNGALVSDFDMSDGGKNTIKNLQTGTIKIDEETTEGWELVHINCYYKDYDGQYRSTDAEFTAKLGIKYVCEFYNEQKAEIEVIKDAQPNDAQDFHFTIEGGRQCELEAASLSRVLVDECPPSFSDQFELDDDSDNVLSNSKSQYVNEGYYTITEDPTAGWTLEDIDCGDIQVVEQTDNSITFFVGAGEKVSCTFVNKKKPGQVLSDVTPMPPAPKVLAATLANTGEDDTARSTIFALTIAGAALVTMFTRRKQETKA